MSLAASGLDDELAAALYELLLSVPLHVPLSNGNASLMRGPTGQLALPVFLDLAALERWGGPEVKSRVCPAQQAAQVAMAGSDVWMVIDPGSSPGGQPIARAGVEALARGTFPGAERYQDSVRFVNELAGAVRSGIFNRQISERAREARVITLGSATTIPPGSGPAEVAALDLVGVRGPDGASLCVAWPTPGPAWEAMPDAPRLTLPFVELVGAARKAGRGIVIDPHRAPIPISPSQLAKLASVL